jgi:hypothetical protein
MACFLKVEYKMIFSNTKDQYKIVNLKVMENWFLKKLKLHIKENLKMDCLMEKSVFIKHPNIFIKGIFYKVKNKVMEY